MYIRPSKNFFFPILAKEIAKTTSGIGLDAGCADMKNRPMFKTNFYVGLDLDLALLEIGKGKYPEAFRLWRNLSVPIQCPSGSFDLVVCTNTLYLFAPYLHPKNGYTLSTRNAIINNLVDVTRETLILEMPRAEPIPYALFQDFHSVKKIYYKNFLSLAYEKLFERNGNLGEHPIAGLKPFRALSWLISRLEYLSCHIPALNQNVLIIARGRNQSLAINVKDVKNIDIEKMLDECRKIPSEKLTLDDIAFLRGSYPYDPYIHSGPQPTHEEWLEENKDRIMAIRKKFDEVHPWSSNE